MAKVYNNALKDYYLKKQKQLQDEKADKLLTGNKSDTKVNETKTNNETPAWKSYYLSQKDKMPNKQAEEKTETQTKKQSALPENSVFAKNLDSKLADYATKQSGKKKNNLLTFGDTKNVSTGATKSQNEKADKLLGITASDQRQEQLNQRKRENTIDRYGKGNIDLDNRPVVKNDDGTISTEKSFSVNIDGKEVLLPSVVDGKVVSEQEAIDHYKKTGEYLGKFDTQEEANEYADKLHNRQEGYYQQEENEQKKIPNKGDQINRYLKSQKWAPTNKNAIADMRYDALEKYINNYIGYAMGTNAPSFMDIDATQDYYAAGRKMGAWDGGDNHFNWSDDKLISSIADENAEIKRLEALRTDADRNAKESAAYENYNNNKGIATALRQIAAYGRIERDYDTTVYNGKPSDYDLYEFDYDARLYDELYNQPGLYASIMNLDNENEDQKEALAEEIDKIWDAIENNKLEELAEEYESDVSGDNEYLNELAFLDKNIDDHKKNLEKYQLELDNRNTAKNIQGDTEYHEENSKGFDVKEELGGGMAFNYIEAKGDRADKAYYYANNPYAEQRAYLNGLGLDDYEMSEEDKAGLVIPGNNQMHEEYFMNDAERAYFNSLYNAGKKDEAIAFLDGIHTALLTRKREYEILSNEYWSKSDVGWAIGAATVLSNVGAGAKGTAGSIMALLGNKEAQNPYSDWYDMSRHTSDVRQFRAEKWGDKFDKWLGENGKNAGEFLNGVTYSMADNLMAMLLSKGVGAGAAGTQAAKTAQRVVQLIMSMEATASSMFENLDKGMDPTEAAILALGSGAIEAITEKYSLETILQTDVKSLLGDKKAFIGYLIKSGIAEGSEEVSSDILNSIFEGMVSKISGHEDELEAEYKALKDQGYSDKDASQIVLKNYLGKLGTSFAAGAASGLAMSTARGIAARTEVGMQYRQEARGLNVGTRLEELFDAAEGVNGGEEYQRQLAILRDKLNTEGTLSQKDRIKLLKLLDSTGSQVVQETAQAETADLIKEMATEKAQKSGIEVTTAKMNIASEGAMKMLLDTENITKEERQALKEVGPVMDVLEEIQDENRQEARREFNEKVNKRVAEKAGGVFAVYQTMDELRNGEKSANEAYDSMIKDAPVATEEEIAEAVENGGERSDSKSEVVYDGNLAEAVSVENGKVVMNNGEQVDPRDVKATNPEMAAVIQAMMEDEVRLYDSEGEVTQEQQQENKPAQQTQVTEDVEEAFENAQNRRVDNLLKGNTAGQQLTSARATQNFQQAQQKAQQKRSAIQYRSGSDNFYNAMLQVAQKEGRTGGNILNEGMKIRVYTMAGLDTPDTRLNPESTRLIREASEADMRVAEAQRTENRRTLTPGNGTATMNGAQYGTKAFDAQVKTLPENQRKVAYALAEVGKAMGTNITIINDPDNNAYFGDESMAGITVNLAGTDDAAGTKYHHGMVTLGHEATHLIEHNSKEGYAALRSYIFQSMIDDDVNIYDRAMEIVNSYNAQGIKIDLNGALREIVANSCDQILSNEKALSKLENENPGLYGKVKAVAKSIYQKIKAALAGMRNSASRDAVYFLNQRADELARLFGEAWDEAKTGEYSGEQTAKQKDSYSLRTVEPIQTSDSSIWQPGHSEAWFRENGFPIYQDVPLDQQEINRDTRKKGHGTQIASTESTYRKLFERLKAQYPETWKKLRVLDASSGLGLGTKAGREMGFNVTDIEPFPNSSYNPDYTDYMELEDKVQSGEVEPFDFIISNAVLNVIPQDTRDNLVSAMGNLLKQGGSMFINVISKDYQGAIHSNPDLESSIKARKGSARTMEGDYSRSGNAAGRGHETFVWGSNSVQKVFSTPEMIGYLKDALGDGYTIKRDNIGMTGVLVTKNAEQKKYSVRENDAAYMQAVENGDMETAQRMVDEAAKANGFTTPKLYHGTRNFGFTEFDLTGHSGGMTFATSDRKIAETYSNETSRSRINEASKLDVFSLEGQELLDTARKYLKKYNEYELMTKEQKEEAKKEARADIRGLAKEVRETVKKYESKLSEVALKDAYKIAEAIENVAKAKTDDDMYDLWNKYESAAWFFKWESEDILFDMLNDERSKAIYDAKNKLSDCLYEGDIYIRDGDYNDRVFDNQLGLELEAELHKGIYELYGNPGRQLAFDAKGSNWNQIVPPEELNLYGVQRTRDVAEAAKAKGYDSVLIRNLKDSGGETPYNFPSDIYIFFDGNALKSADPVTYDDNGEPVDLSKRFDMGETDIRYSMRDYGNPVDNNYMQAVENGDMETAQRMVDEAAERAGNTIRGDHGTVSKYFTVFDREKGNPEGDWGRGFYFSSNITDANRNYASEFGPDVQAKIERLADNLDWMDGYEGLSYEERYDIAKKMIVQDNPRIITAAIRMQNPVVIGGENETFFDYTEEYDEETEEYGEPEGPFVDLMDALEYAAGEYEYARVDFSDLWAYATEYQGMDARTFEKLAKEAVGDIEDEEGNLVGNEIVRDAFERAGYDGIVDNTVAWKFGSKSGRGAGMVGVNEGTTHYIAFDSAQIKQTDPVTYDDNGNVIPLSERFNPNNKDIRYSLAERDVREYLAKWADQHVRENNDNKAEILKKYGIKMSDLPTGPILYENQWARYGISKADQEKLAMLDRDTAKWEEKRMDAMGLDENDLGAQYVSAWKYNDIARMEQILMEKMSGIDGIIPYKAPHWYDTAQHRQIANLIKERNPEAITIAAVEMANLVPKNAVLIPMPPRSGKVTASTDTMLLANRISELTGRPVLNALEGAERMSRKEAKDNNIKMTAEGLGFRLVEDIPDGMIPYFVDNVVGSGVTAQAAHDAAGGGITLAYAKSTRAGIEGLKNASPTFSDKYHMYLIPLDARMDMTKSGPKGAQYSYRDESNLDIHQWMTTVNENSLQTEAEKALLRDYKDLRMKWRVAQEKITKYGKDIARLEAMESLPADERDRLKKLRIYEANARTTMAETEKKLAQIMGSEGYARMMYEQNLIWQNVTSGQSLEEIMQRVNAMEEATEKMKAELREGQERLRKLGESEAVRAMRSYVGKSRVEQLAAAIRKDYGSRMNKQDLMDGLTRIALKMAAGQDVQQDLEDLAWEVAQGIYGGDEATYRLKALNGLTIRLSRQVVKDIIGSNSSIKELRQLVRGSGLKIVELDKANEKIAIRDETGKIISNGNLASMDSSWDELCDMIPELRNYKENQYNLDNPTDQAMAVVDFAMETVKKYQNYGTEQYRHNIPDIMADMLAYASIVGQDIPTDAKSKAQIDRLMKYIQEMAGEVNAESDRIDNMIRTVDDLQARARSAGSRVGSLKFDIQSAINYMDETAKQAILREKEKKQSAIVEQLKSDQVQELMRVNQQWRDMMERDRNARKIAEDNAKIRGQVDRLATRIMKYLYRPDAQKFIPEHMQDMARVLLEMIVDNDLGGRHLTEWETKALVESKRVLDAWTARDGEANIYNSALAMDPNGDMGMVDLITDLYLQLGEGLEKYNAYKKNQTKLEGLKARNEALNQIQDAFTKLYNIFNSEMNIALGDRKVAVMDAAMKIYAASQQSKFKGERKGFASRQRDALHKFIISGNLTPEYFFKMLKNYGLDEIWEEYHRAENRNGLLMKSAKDRLAEIAEKHGYKSWDMDQKFTLQLEKGGTVQMTLGQMMSLMATWNREQKLGPEMSQHLEYGGFVLEDREKQTGKPRREKVSNKPRRVTGADMVRIGALLSDEQKEFVDEVVQYLSKDMSEIGNDASMRAFGIKKYKEKYYFPMKSWNGNLNQRSDQTGNVNNDSRLMHQGFTKQRLNRARNALLIGDFMDVAVNHIVGMVNYATMGVANENLQKVLNARMEENGGESGDYDYDNLVKRNIRAIIEEAYGKETADYLDELKKQMNGGIVKEERDFWDKGLSLFRKNAVAGSLSVAAQQPLSYIRAAMMINPKYLMQALNPKYWKGSYAEMMEHSGVAVIKDMGRFDMNAGQTAKQFIKPDEKTGKARAAYEWIGDKATILPELMDRMTWTRMWTAVKLEQAEEHPGMNQDSAAFMDLCAERFNDVMRKTQVYDSTLVKSANMRSQSRFKRSVTSFMAEPTLTLNVLADAVQNARTPGGKARLAKAMAVFIVSAIAQAAIKAGFSSGRSPDDDKTWMENFLNRFGSNVLSEANPVSLIPGYSDMIAVLKTGELEDDALGAYGKIITAGKKIIDILNQEESKNGLYRDIEDSIGQLAQIFTNVPAKNIMRDGRAIYNWFSGDTYAKRPTSANILKYQALETLNNADNLWGVFNKWLGDAGYKTDNNAYYKRLYNAKKNGNAKEEQDLLDYLLNGKNVKQETIDSKVKSLAKDDSEATEAEKIDFMLEEEMDPTEYIRNKYKDGKMTRAEAEKGLKAANPDKSDDDIWWIMDRMDYQKETGESVSGNYYRLKDAIEANDSQSIQSAIKLMLAHGYTEKQIKEWLGSKTTGFKTAYLNAKGYDKVKIKDALIKAYKAIGINSAEAEMIINKWK